MLARILIASTHPRDHRRFEEWAVRGRRNAGLVRHPDDLIPLVEGLVPDYIFFPHWSARIPASIYERWECILFHMTDLPFGRGGSPLQNLILRGIYETQLSAIRVTGEMDAGPVYLKRPLSLHGSAEEIYGRASDLAFVMMDEILEREPVPVPQRGEGVTFRRRTPAQSEIDGIERPRALSGLHDFIRMLDADGYPPAFLKYQGFRFEFTRSALRDGHILADVRITFPGVDE